VASWSHANLKKADFEKFIPKNAKVGLGFFFIVLDNETNV
jgi:hypothetical protein